jgi:YD repeat-containing protein
LTGFSDPEGNLYKMDRNRFGDLLSIATPSGEWLRFERDSQHRVQRIKSSEGRTVNYEYDTAECLIRVSDSEQHTTSYTYENKFMLTVARGADPAILTNTYDSLGNIQSQTMADGGKFIYHYVPDPQRGNRNMVPDLITAPNGLLTYIRYRSEAYTQSLPIAPRPTP